MVTLEFDDELKIEQYFIIINHVLFHVKSYLFVIRLQCFGDDCGDDNTYARPFG